MKTNTSLTLFDPVLGLRFAVLEYLPMMVIGAALLQDEYDQSEPAGTGGDDRIHTVILQFAIWPK